MAETLEQMRETWLRERDVCLTFAGELTMLDRFLAEHFVGEHYPATAITGVQRAIYLLHELKAKRQ